MQCDSGDSGDGSCGKYGHDDFEFDDEESESGELVDQKNILPLSEGSSHNINPNTTVNDVHATADHELSHAVIVETVPHEPSNDGLLDLLSPSSSADSSDSDSSVDMQHVCEDACHDEFAASTTDFIQMALDKNIMKSIPDIPKEVDVKVVESGNPDRFNSSNPSNHNNSIGNDIDDSCNIDTIDSINSNHNGNNNDNQCNIDVNNNKNGNNDVNNMNDLRRQFMEMKEVNTALIDELRLLSLTLTAQQGPPQISRILDPESGIISTKNQQKLESEKFLSSKNPVKQEKAVADFSNKECKVLVPELKAESSSPNYQDSPNVRQNVPQNVPQNGFQNRKGTPTATVKEDKRSYIYPPISTSTATDAVTVTVTNPNTDIATVKNADTDKKTHVIKWYLPSAPADSTPVKTDSKCQNASDLLSEASSHYSTGTDTCPSTDRPKSAGSGSAHSAAVAVSEYSRGRKSPHSKSQDVSDSLSPRSDKSVRKAALPIFTKCATTLVPKGSTTQINPSSHPSATATHSSVKNHMTLQLGGVVTRESVVLTSDRTNITKSEDGNIDTRSKIQGIGSGSGSGRDRDLMTPAKVIRSYDMDNLGCTVASRGSSRGSVGSSSRGGARGRGNNGQSSALDIMNRRIGSAPLTGRPETSILDLYLSQTPLHPYEGNNWRDHTAHANQNYDEGHSQGQYQGQDWGLSQGYCPSHGHRQDQDCSHSPGHSQGPGLGGRHTHRRGLSSSPVSVSMSVTVPRPPVGSKHSHINDFRGQLKLTPRMRDEMQNGITDGMRSIILTEAGMKSSSGSGRGRVIEPKDRYDEGHGSCYAFDKCALLSPSNNGFENFDNYATLMNTHCSKIKRHYYHHKNSNNYMFYNGISNNNYYYGRKKKKKIDIVLNHRKKMIESLALTYIADVKKTFPEDFRREDFRKEDFYQKDIDQSICRRNRNKSKSKNENNSRNNSRNDSGIYSDSEDEIDRDSDSDWERERKEIRERVRENDMEIERVKNIEKNIENNIKKNIVKNIDKNIGKNIIPVISRNIPSERDDFDENENENDEMCGQFLMDFSCLG